MPHRSALKLRLQAFEQRILPATFYVTNTTDSSAGSLRYAISQLNIAPGADTVVFDPATFSSASTITLTTGQISITQPLTIVGPPALVTIDAGKLSRHFNIDVAGLSKQAMTFSNLILINGSSATSGGSIFCADEALTLNNCTLKNNTTGGDGGAIALPPAPVVVPASLTLNDCIISNNTCTGVAANGGGIAIPANHTVAVTRCTVSANSVGQAGGGIFFSSASGSLAVVDSTLSGNRANVASTSLGGGGIYMTGSGGQTTTIRNCTISGNSARTGAGIQVFGTGNNLVVENSTVAFSTATVGGGGIVRAGGSPNISLTSTIVGKNSAPSSPDISTAVAITANFCLISNTTGALLSGANNKTNVDPLLAALASNGGSTQTHGLLSTSPAMNVGSNPSALSNDQRGPGYPRVLGSAIDIGACEGAIEIPIARAITPNVFATGGTTSNIYVRYTDDVGIDVTKLGFGDLTVTGPNGFSILATFISVDINTKGTPRVATYKISAPGGAWDNADAGAYTISLNANEVIDIDTPTTHAVPAGVIGNFTMSVGGSYVVDSTSDDDDYDTSAGRLSLREAIRLANLSSGSADTITFSPSVFATATTLKPTMGQFSITDPLTIVGPAAILTIDAHQASRHFFIDVASKTGQAISLSNLTLSNGINYVGDGGAIDDVNEALTLNNCTLTNNTTFGSGGAVSVDANGGALTMNDCALSNNLANKSTLATGGAVNFRSGGSLALARCTLNSNTSTANAGGIFLGTANGTVTISDTTIANNQGNSVGGTTNSTGAIHLSGQTVTIRNSTISGNSAANHAGIHADLTTVLTLQNSTVAFNKASLLGGSGGGVSRTGTAIVNIVSSIVAKNTGMNNPDIFGAVTADFCLIGNSAGATITGSNNKLNVDPLLSPLANNGGPTQTHALAANSPALSNGSNPALLANDQRGAGFSRSIGGGTDIGAYESPSTAPTAWATSPNVSTAGGPSQTITVTYLDEAGINVATLGTGDLTVTGPNGFSVAPTFVSVDVNSNGSPRVTTYQFTPPGGAWNSFNVGSYTITVNAGEVADIETPTPKTVAAGAFGSFVVAIPSAYVVDLATDENDGNYSAGDLSLREALTLVNAASVTNDTITFSPAVFSAPTTLTLTLGALTIADAVVINGPAAPLTIDANKLSRIFVIDVPNQPPQPITISGLTLRNAMPPSFNSGGAILATAELLLLSNVTFDSNSAGSSGGAIFASTGEVDLENCTFANNGASSNGALDAHSLSKLTIRNCSFASNNASDPSSSSGAAVYVYSTGTVMTTLIEDCTFVNNKAGFRAGAMALPVSAGLTIRRCTFNGNAAMQGGGGALEVAGPIQGPCLFESCTFTNNSCGTEGGGAIDTFVGDPMILRNCTFTGNTSASNGGALAFAASSGSMTIQNCTITNNSAAIGGGLCVVTGGTATIMLESSIVSDNTSSSGPDLSSPAAISAKNSAIGTTSGATSFSDLGGNLFGINLLLGPLGNFGGPTQTRVPLPGSPLLDAGSNPAALATDQRGYSRVAGSAIDIGAVERQTVPPRVLAVAINSGAVQRSRVTSVAVTFDQAMALPVNPADAFTLRRQSDNALVDLSATINGATVTFNFSGALSDFGSLADGRYTLTALAGQISGEGAPLDGNSDGIGGDDYVLIGDPATNKLFRLFGDADGNGIVDGVDFGAFRTAFNTNSSIFDFDGSGIVDGLDFGQFRQRFGVVI